MTLSANSFLRALLILDKLIVVLEPISVVAPLGRDIPHAGELVQVHLVPWPSPCLLSRPGVFRAPP
jgi:hypothetical protein